MLVPEILTMVPYPHPALGCGMRGVGHPLAVQASWRPVGTTPARAGFAVSCVLRVCKQTCNLCIGGPRPCLLERAVPVSLGGVSYTRVQKGLEALLPDAAGFIQA